MHSIKFASYQLHLNSYTTHCWFTSEGFVSVTFVYTISFDTIGQDKTKINWCDRVRIETKFFFASFLVVTWFFCKGDGRTEFKISINFIYLISFIHFCITVLQISFATDMSSLFSRPAICCTYMHFARSVLLSNYIPFQWDV